MIDDRARMPSREEQKREFSRRLIKMMDDHRLTVSQAAKICGVGPSTVQAWRSGSMPTDLIAVKRLADQFGVSFVYLMTGEAA